MAISLKDFTVGQPAYMVKMNEYSRKEPEIYTAKVEKVGRKYVTVLCMGDRRYSCEDEYRGYLVEDSNYGYKTLLFPNEKAAQNHIKAHELRFQIRDFIKTRAFDNMSLERLESICSVMKEGVE